MQTSILRRSFLPAALAAMLLTALFVLYSPWAASAHDDLIESDPAADSTVETLPQQIRLTFSAAIIAEGRTAVEVLDPEGVSVVEGAPETEGSVVTQALGDATMAGQYRVLWQVTSSDGHLTSKEFAFTVASVDEPAAPESETADSDTADSDAGEDPGAADTEEPAETEQADDAAAQADDAAAEEGSADTTFQEALPWIIIGVLLAAGGGALIAVLLKRAKRGGAEHSDGASGQ